ncbi:hypothetical protein LSTR_LSTR007815 [Laodelphax striatellus]|uniref:Protein krueppel n=1 Tax=Laodelphax striatellus TaxID=195883 RepID=A0A482WMQ7_LAOST|nr:hypothetical protein LSTR_LSTR007815 [Laodelphax striatellus]
MEKFFSRGKGNDPSINNCPARKRSDPEERRLNYEKKLMKEEEERLKRLEEEDKICDYTSFSEVLSVKIKSTDLENLEKQCRFCLNLISINDYYEEIFSEGIISGMLKEKMNKCFDIKKMNFQERLPNKICSSCVKKLDEFYLFSSEFEINQEKLEQSTIKTALLIEDIHSERENKHNAAESGIESGHKQLVLKQNFLLTEKLKVLAIKDEKDDLFASSICNTNFIGGIDDSPALIVNKKEKKELEEVKEEIDTGNERGTYHLKNTVVCDPLQSENVDCNSSMRINEMIPSDIQQANDRICLNQASPSQFNNEYEFQSHVKSHPSNEKLPRCYSGVSTVSSEFLQPQSGVSSGNNNNNNFQCQCHLCPSIFNSKNLLNKHIRQHIIERSVYSKEGLGSLGSTSMKIICKICKKGFFTRSRYDLHVMKDHDPQKEVPPRRKGRIFQCNHCNKIFKNKVDITRHVSIHLKRKSPHVCSVCGKEYVFPVALKNHVLTHNPDYKIECPVCLLTFSKRKELKTHKCHSNTPDTAMFKCKTCNLEFSSLKYLKIHEDLDHGIGAPYTCDYCTRTFLSNDALLAHMNESHFEVNGSTETGMKVENTYDIEEKQITDLLFDEDDDLTTNLEILMCTLCGTLCITNEEFQEHMAGHINIIM